jgi:hypothetical protein
LGCISQADLSTWLNNKNQLELTAVHSGKIESWGDLDLIIDWTGPTSRSPLSAEKLTDRIKFLGECRSPRGLETAIAEALKVIQELD